MDDGSFIVRTDVNVSDWGVGGDVDSERECTESWLLEENPLPYQEIKPAPVVWRSGALTNWTTSPPIYGSVVFLLWLLNQVNICLLFLFQHGIVMPVQTVWKPNYRQRSQQRNAWSHLSWDCSLSQALQPCPEWVEPIFLLAVLASYLASACVLCLYGVKFSKVLGAEYACEYAWHCSSNCFPLLLCQVCVCLIVAVVSFFFL